MNTTRKIPELGQFSPKSSAKNYPHFSIFGGWKAENHPIKESAYTLRNTRHDWILGCFPSRASALLFARYLPPAETAKFGDISFAGGDR